MNHPFLSEELQAACENLAQSVYVERGETRPDVEQALALAFRHHAISFAEAIVEDGGDAKLVAACVRLLSDQEGFDKTQNAMEWFYHSVHTMLILANAPRVLTPDSRLAAVAIKDGLTNALHAE